MKKLIILIALIIPVTAFADSEVMPKPLLFVDATHTYYLKLIPGEGFRTEQAKGSVYKVSKGNDELQYEFSGWYSFSILLSPGGEYIARLGPWPRIEIPPEKMLAIAFYKKGKLMRQYMVSDLVKDPRSLPRSVSHYEWGGKLEWTGNWWENTVQVVTKENRVIKFDITNGQMK